MNTARTAEILALSPVTARRIVERMGATGQPPERGARLVNIGTDEYLDILRRECLQQIVQTGSGSTFKLVQAPFGGGKTQFLHCLREIAWEEGFLAATVGVSPQECPFDDPLRIYAEVMRNLELPPTSLDEEPSRGIDVVLRRMIEQRVAKYGEVGVRAWVAEELREANVESRSFQRAVRLFAEAILDSNEAREDLLGAYLRGERVDAEELAGVGVRETIDEGNAFRFLRSLAQMTRFLGLPGLVLLFDEMDRVMSLSSRRKRSIGDNLRQMIDHCGQSTLPGVLWVYAVPPEFMTLVVPEYPALAQRLKTVGRFSGTSPLQPVVDLDHLPLGATDLFAQIGERLRVLYERGYGCQFDPAIQSANLRALSREMGQSSLESGSRRTFVKSVVQLLSQQHRDKERELSKREIGAFAATTVEARAPMEGEEVLDW